MRNKAWTILFLLVLMYLAWGVSLIIEYITFNPSDLTHLP